MSHWGVWPTQEGDQHIVPCDEQNNVLGGHRQSLACFCNPVPDLNQPKVIVHNDPERGGYNA